MEKITINDPHDLKPFDMLKEGMFVNGIHFKYRNNDYDLDYVIAEIGTCEITEREFHGQTLKYPKWGQLIRVPIKFPITVIRGVLGS